MSVALPSALVTSPSATPVPTDLARHLEICRLQAELEALEAQLARARTTEGETVAAGDAVGPFAERAQDLVDRMVESLRCTAREEHRQIVAHGRAEAEARLALARMRAEDIVSGARDDLLRAIAEREAAFGSHLAVDLEDVTAGRSDPAPSPGARTDLGLPTPTAAVSPDGVVPPDLDPDPVLASAPAPAPASEPEVEVEAEQSPPSPSSPPSTGAPTSRAVGTEMGSQSSFPTPVGAVAVEEARTDAAFDVWLAVAPVPVEQADDTDDRTREDARPGRSPMVLALEIGGVLLLVAALVVLGLVLVG